MENLTPFSRLYVSTPCFELHVQDFFSDKPAYLKLLYLIISTNLSSDTIFQSGSKKTRCIYMYNPKEGLMRVEETFL